MATIESTEMFSVYVWNADGKYEQVRTCLPVDEAMQAARRYCTNPAARIGITTKVMITDGGDMSVFEWERAKGVVFPETHAGAWLLGNASIRPAAMGG
jgi:hypothetical protein